MRWLDYLKDQAEEAADGVAGAVGGAVSAVTPDFIENAATSVVNNPVVRSAANMFGPASQVVNAVNFVQNPTAASMAAASNPANMTPGRPVRPTNPIALGQQSVDLARYFGNAVAQTPDYFQNTFSPTLIAALNNIKGPTDLGNIGRAGLAAADPWLRVANSPVEDIHKRQGGDAYAIAKSGGKRPADAATAFNIAADWAEQHPEEWPNIIDVYENGYDHDQDGQIDFIGNEAVWEYFIGKQNRATRIGADIINDPWNAVPALGAAGRGISAGAEAGSAVARIGQGVQRAAQVADTVGELPFRAAGAVIRRTPGASQAGNVIRNLPGIRETQSSIDRRLENQVGDTLRPVAEAIEGAQAWPRGVPEWATPQAGTGSYRVVTISAEPNRGAAYIVDPQGNPIPGTENAGKGKGVAKRLRDQAEKYNTDGGPTGATSSPTVTNPRYRLPGQGESAAPNQSGVTPFPEEAPPITPDAVPEGMVGTTNIDGTTRVDPLPEPDPPAVDPYDVSTPVRFQTDHLSQRDYLERRSRIKTGEMSFNAPNINDARLVSIAESLRATRPDDTARFYADLGIEPRTGAAIPGTPAGTVDQVDRAIGERYFPDFAEKAYLQRVNAMRFVVDTEAPTFQRVFGIDAKPPMSQNARVQSVPELKKQFLALRIDDPLRAAHIGDLVVKAVLGGDDDAFRALSDLAEDFPWIADELPEIARLAQDAKAFTTNVSDRFNVTPNIPEQGALDLDAAAPTEQVADDVFAGIDDEHVRLYLELRAEEEARLASATNPRDIASAERHIDEANQEIINGLLRIADQIDPEQIDNIAMDFVERGYHGAPDALIGINRAYGNTPFPEEVVDDLPVDGTTPIDADGTTPIPDEVVDTTTTPEAPPAGGTGFVRDPDPGTQTLLETMEADGTISREEFEFLRQPLPGRAAPVIDEFIDRLRNGMSAEEAIGDLQRSIMASGVEPGKVKAWLHKWVGGHHKFVRQSMQHNVLNGAPGGIGDLLGNAMHLWQTGQFEAAARMFSPRMVWMAFNPTGGARGAGRAGSRGIAREFTRETNDLLAGFDRELPEAILGPSALNDARFGDDDLILTKATRNRGRGTRTAASVVQSQWAQDWRKGVDALSRGVLTTQVLDDLLDPAVDRFKRQLADKGFSADQTLDAIRRHATDARAPEAWNARGGSRTMRSFSPEDVFAITGNDQLSRAWRGEINSLYKEAAKTAKDTFFAGAKRYGLDDVASKVFFFHFWQSRAIGLQARSMIRSPRVLGGYYRMIQGAMNEADRNGYPKTFRGLTHYWGDTAAGFYGLFNPVGFLVPAMMFSDLASQQGENWTNKVTGILPIGPMTSGALAALGLLDNTPNMLGTQRIQNYVTDVVNWGNANGLDFALGGVIADPVQTWTQHIFEKINAGVRASGVPGAQRFEPYEPINGRIDTIQSVVWHEAELEWGSSENWSNAQWDEIQDAMTAVETGGRGNDRAENAIRDWNDANMRNRFAGLITPQGSVLRYGPREVARNDKDDDPFNRTPGENQRRIINASPETRALYIAQEQRDNLGTDRQRYFWDTQQLILYGVDDLPTDQLNNYIDVNGQRVTAQQIKGMTYDQRVLLVNAYTAEHNGTEELASYKKQRNEFIKNNPSLAEYREYTSFVGDYENGGTAGFLKWASQVSPEFKRRHDDHREFLKDRGSSGAVLDTEMERWAMSADAWTAFRGEKGGKYDAAPLDGASPARDPQGMLQRSGGYGGGGGSGSSSLADRIRKDLQEYETESASYQGTTGMPGLWGRANENMYGPAPNLSAAARRYVAWAQGQPANADTSPEAYAAWVETGAA